jgi:hypothetical protein
MHPHVLQTWLTQAQRDANTIGNQRGLIRQLEGRLKAANDRAYELEMIVGVDKRAHRPACLLLIAGPAARDRGASDAQLGKRSLSGHYGVNEKLPSGSRRLGQGSAFS